MPCLDGFTFQWLDAWWHYGWGYEATLTIGVNEKRIDFLVDGKKYGIALKKRENKFVEMLLDCGIFSWNGKEYVNYDVCDGYMWNLSVSIGGRTVNTGGCNGYPAGFDILMESLHSEYGLPYAELDSQASFSIQKAIRETEVRN